MVPIPAHGLLGAADEILFAGVAIIFLVMMVVSWVYSRNLPPVEEDPEEDNLAAAVVGEPAARSDSDEHFELK